jgi:DNA replication protein DnaC
MEIDHISLLKSWLFWKDWCKTNKDKLKGYTFPQLSSTYHSCMGEFCPLCNNFGILSHEGVPIYCLCSTLRELEKNHNELKYIETTHKPCLLDDLHPINNPPEGKADLELLLRDIRKWLKHPQRWIVIQGGFGCGKSHILQAIKTQLDGLAAFVSVDDFQQNLFVAKNDEGAVKKLINDLSAIPILLLDDWGIEHNSPWTTNTLASIVNRRYRFSDEFPTVVTFNTPLQNLLNSPDMARRRIISRLIDGEISTVYRLRQVDYRIQAAYNKNGVQ